MTELDLKAYFNLLMDATQAIMPDDIKGFVIILVDVDNVCQYGSTLNREDMIASLREMADRLEKRNTIER